jgi:hypothetical protein
MMQRFLFPLQKIRILLGKMRTILGPLTLPILVPLGFRSTQFILDSIPFIIININIRLRNLLFVTRRHLYVEKDKIRLKSENHILLLLKITFISPKPAKLFHLSESILAQ